MAQLDLYSVHRLARNGLLLAHLALVVVAWVAFETTDIPEKTLPRAGFLALSIVTALLVRRFMLSKTHRCRDSGIGGSEE